jgi:hypothetical protein
MRGENRSLEVHMRVALIIGALLIAGGLYILIQAPSFSQDKTVLKVGPLEAKAQEQHEIPPWVGGAALAAGVVLVVVGFRGKA